MNSIVETFKGYTEFSTVNWERVLEATKETIYMTLASVVLVFIIGLILGLILYETQSGHTPFSRVTYKIISAVVNFFRSVPFLILIVLLIPFTKLLLDTMRGPTAGLPALVFSAAPFYARLVETGFREIDRGVIEAAESMGASKLELITKVLIPESMPSLIAGITTTAISLVGYTAMAGVIGAGGLGNLAYLVGFQRSQPTVTVVSTVIIVAIVYIIQKVGEIAVKAIDKR